MIDFFNVLGDGDIIDSLVDRRYTPESQECSRQKYENEEGEESMPTKEGEDFSHGAKNYSEGLSGLQRVSGVAKQQNFRVVSSCDLRYIIRAALKICYFRKTGSRG